MWPFNRLRLQFAARTAVREPPSPSAVRDMVIATIWNRAFKRQWSAGAYLASKEAIADRIVARVDFFYSQASMVDQLVDLLEAEEFSLFEDILDGSEGAFA